MPTATTTLPKAVRRARAKFLDYYPGGFEDEDYVAAERDYKWQAHRRWRAELGRPAFSALLDAGAYDEVARRAVRIESRTNLLFSFEKMALRDAVRSRDGGRRFAEALYAWIYGPGSEPAKFTRWVESLQDLPRRQTRVATWPTATIFGFLARPKMHLDLKPTVMRRAAAAYGRELAYRSTLGWDTYAAALDLARTVRHDLADLQPRDQIDIQSFLWVLGSGEYPD
jgi:hypothetical protein